MPDKVNKWLDPMAGVVPFSLFSILLYSTFSSSTHIAEPNLFISILELCVFVVYTVMLILINRKGKILKILYDYCIGIPSGVAGIVVFSIFCTGNMLPVFTGFEVLINLPIIYFMFIIVVLSLVRIVMGLGHD
jgi:hypothetical protein